jgi:hypothetical protein
MDKRTKDLQAATCHPERISTSSQLMASQKKMLDT